MESAFPQAEADQVRRAAIQRPGPSRAQRVKAIDLERDLHDGAGTTSGTPVSQHQLVMLARVAGDETRLADSLTPRPRSVT